MNNLHKETDLKKKERECEILKIQMKKKDEEIISLTSRIEMFESQFKALPNQLKVLLTSNENIEDFVSVRQAESESDNGYHSNTHLVFNNILKAVGRNMESVVKKDRFIIREQLEQISKLENELTVFRNIVRQYSLKIKELSQKNRETARLLFHSKSVSNTVKNNGREFSNTAKTYSRDFLDSTDGCSTISETNCNFNYQCNLPSLDFRLSLDSRDHRYDRNIDNASNDVAINSNVSFDHSASIRSDGLTCPICEKKNWKSLSELQEHCLTCGSIAGEEETEVCIFCQDRIPKTLINEHANNHLEEEEHLDFYFA
ncbi:unnamed protein product [Dimorphilus gyrociliatus]|uniref:Uncharacterized protein n=1 Tax=Dimorphilus gyrociliatus TaxID=2664684 RepID=A0A7I8VWZ3_9ANNE|nr:unnamed protein product [Dimorphilus gyrociliatus]